MGVPDHLTCLLRNLYAGQETTVKTGHGTMDWFQIGKGVCQGCILSPGLFNFYAEYIMRNTGLDEAQAGIKISRRNINNLQYADDPTLMAENEELQFYHTRLRIANLVFCLVESLRCVQLFATPQTAARQASLSITNSCSLVKLMSISWCAI